MAKVVRLRREPSGGGNYISYTIGIPSEIGKLLDERMLHEFSVELTEDGILYRPWKLESVPPIPAWLGGGDVAQGSTAKKNALAVAKTLATYAED